MSLGDRFSQSSREEHAKRGLQVGSVLKLRVVDTHPPKEKRFIVVGLTSDGVSLATVYINSDINLIVNYSPELRQLQHYIESDGRDYLDHDSYVDCSQLITRDRAEIHYALMQRPEAFIGLLSENDLQTINGKILSSEKIKGKVKKKFGFYPDAT